MDLNHSWTVVRRYLQQIRILECDVEGLVLLSQVSHTYILNHMGLLLTLRLLPGLFLSPPPRTWQLARNPVASPKSLCVDNF